VVEELLNPPRLLPRNSLRPRILCLPRKTTEECPEDTPQSSETCVALANRKLPRLRVARGMAGREPEPKVPRTGELG
jgi:hypothetical protein